MWKVSLCSELSGHLMSRILGEYTEMCVHALLINTYLGRRLPYIFTETVPCCHFLLVVFFFCHLLVVYCHLLSILSVYCHLSGGISDKC